MGLNFLETFNELVDALHRLARATETQDVCCGPASELPYYDQDYSPTGNPETSTFCERAHSLVTNWTQASKETLTLAITGDQVGLGVLALITAALSLPLAILIGIVTLVAIGITDIAQADMENEIDDLYYDLVCAIYNSVNASEAKATIDALIHAANLEAGFGIIMEQIMQDYFSVDAINQVFNETYPILTEAIGETCSECAATACDCPPMDDEHYAQADKTANGLLRTWIGECAPNLNDSWLYVELPCSRCFEVISYRNWNPFGTSPILRVRQEDDCVPTNLITVSYDPANLLGKQFCGRWIVIDSKDSCGSPVEVDLIIYPGRCVGTGNPDQDCPD